MAASDILSANYRDMQLDLCTRDCIGSFDLYVQMNALHTEAAGVYGKTDRSAASRLDESAKNRFS